MLRHEVIVAIDGLFVNVFAPVRFGFMVDAGELHAQCTPDQL